jgi:ankyrin repeat protein
MEVATMPATRFFLCSALLFLTGVALGAGTNGSPLAEAVKNGDVKEFHVLLEHHADVNAPQVDGTTALHWAAHRDDGDAVELLIRAGANVKAVNRYGVTPLFLASMNGNASIIEALLRAGADANTTRPEGETVLMTAARTGNVAAVKALLKTGAEVNTSETRHGQTALMWAVDENNAAAAQALIEAGADVHARSKVGFTPLLFAARAGHIDAVRVLLASGADVNETLPDGITPLVLSIINAKYELAAVLLDSGADPNASGQGWTALHQIVWTRRPHVGFNNPEPVHTDDLDGLDLVRMLIQYGADPNARVKKELKEEPRTGLNGFNRTGATPFLLAAKDVDVDLMRVLAENGADPLLTNVNNTTPLMAAAGVGIFTPGEDPGTNEEALEAVKLALQLGGDVAAVDNNGETALHGAAARGASALVQFLVDRGAKLDLKNKRGWTPLTIADGVILGGTFKRQPETAALLRELMNR